MFLVSLMVTTHGNQCKKSIVDIKNIKCKKSKHDTTNNQQRERKIARGEERNFKTKQQIGKSKSLPINN